MGVHKLDDTDMVQALRDMADKIEKVGLNRGTVQAQNYRKVESGRRITRVRFEVEIDRVDPQADEEPWQAPQTSHSVVPDPPTSGEQNSVLGQPEGKTGVRQRDTGREYLKIQGEPPQECVHKFHQSKAIIKTGEGMKKFPSGMFIVALRVDQDEWSIDTGDPVLGPEERAILKSFVDTIEDSVTMTKDEEPS